MVGERGPLRGPGSEGSKGSQGSEGGGFAAFGGDEYKISVTEFPFVSPLLHDEETEPPSLGRGWPLKGKRLTMICASLLLLQIMFAVHAVRHRRIGA